jgi:predicted nucleotidyltransferase
VSLFLKPKSVSFGLNSEKMLTATQQREIVDIMKPYGPLYVGIFGSYARNEQRTDSDLDILVQLEQPIDFFEFVELEERLSASLGLKVDLVTTASLHPDIRVAIEADLKQIV